MTDDILQLFGRIEGVVILKWKDSAFVVTGVHAHGTAQGEQNLVLTCLDDTLKEKTFKITAKHMMDAFAAVVSEEQQTGLKQLLVIDVEKGEWCCYQIDAELKQKLPGLSAILSAIEKRDYVV